MNDFLRITKSAIMLEFASLIFPYISYLKFSWIFTLVPGFLWKWTPFISTLSLSTEWIFTLVSVNFLFCFLISWLYSKIKKVLNGSELVKGMKFGLLLFCLIVGIPIFSIYILVIINPKILIYFSVEGFAECVLYGLILSFCEKNNSPNVLNS